MKQYFLLILTFFSLSLTFSQEKFLEGSVSDSLNKPIPYSNVGVLNKSTGTVTNENGFFTLIINETMELDTLKISCLGFKPIEVLIHDVINNPSLLHFQLDNFVEKLDEVVVSSKKTKIYNSGKLKTKTKNQVIFSNPKIKNKNLGTEIGRAFKLGEDKATYLKEFKFFIKSNNYNSVKFRINIYSINEKKPGKRLYQGNIFAEADRNYTDWVIVNLSAFDIVVQQNIIITVEWIEHSKNGTILNLPMIIPSFNSTHYYKFGSQNSWKKYTNISTAMYLTYEQ